jgi:hypothetical protein
VLSFLGEKEPLAWLTRTVVPALFGRGGEASTAELAKLVRAGNIRREDAVVLTALASRRAGGEAWNTFRAEAPELLGGQPLNGDVVVFVNGLSATRLPLLVAGRATRAVAECFQPLTTDA